MKQTRAIGVLAVLVGGLLFVPVSGGDARAQAADECEPAKTLFLNLTSGRVQRMQVAFLVGQANLQAIGADLTLFLADEAAILAVHSDYWPTGVMTPERRAELLCVQQGGPGCPAVASLQDLLLQGAQLLGCPLCVQEVVKEYLSIFNADGSLNQAAWETIAIDGAAPIAPTDFEALYDGVSGDGLCPVDSAVMSF